ncbi:MAG: DUF3291 domain-containing protein [Vampirovibrio sp.]|nr:DUF3291 domain-containing protein [Vampirovibrio sp.]
MSSPIPENENLKPSAYHLCHLNVAPAVAYIHDKPMAGFVENLPRVNQLAYESPGFVWHLKVDINNPDDLTMYGEPGMLFNLSVWESVESLWDYTRSPEHTKMMDRRREWFCEMSTPNYVLWWISKDIRPTLKEAKERLKLLTEIGPNEHAFTFERRFKPSSNNKIFVSH